MILLLWKKPGLHCFTYQWKNSFCFSVPDVFAPNIIARKTFHFIIDRNVFDGMLNSLAILYFLPSPFSTKPMLNELFIDIARTFDLRHLSFSIISSTIPLPFPSVFTFHPLQSQYWCTIIGVHPPPRGSSSRSCSVDCVRTITFFSFFFSVIVPPDLQTRPARSDRSPLAKLKKTTPFNSIQLVFHGERGAVVFLVYGCAKRKTNRLVYPLAMIVMIRFNVNYYRFQH